MSTTIVILTAISFVIQVLLIRHKFIKRRWHDLKWDIPMSVASIVLGMMGGVTVMTAMLIAGNMLSISLLFTKPPETVYDLPDFKSFGKTTLIGQIKKFK